MISRKRQASESLFPTRAAKFAKTSSSSSRRTIDMTSAEENSSILSRWGDLWHEVWKLGRETVSHVVGDAGEPRPMHLTIADQPQIPRSRSSPKRRPPRRSNFPHRPPSPNTYRHYPRFIPRPSESTSRVTTSDGTIAVLPQTSSMAISQLDYLLAMSQRLPTQPLCDRPFKDTRRHIHRPMHEAKLKVQRLKDQYAMAKEIYVTRGVPGYQADLWALKEEEQLASQNAPPPAPALSGMPQHPRMPSVIAGPNAAFVERAFRKARDALNGPKPPKPYSACHDRFRLSTRERSVHDRLPSSLPPEDEAKVDAFLRRRGVVSKYAREQVKDTDLARLQPSQWLNDEIINFYGAMILGRSEGNKENPCLSGVSSGRGKPLNVHYFNTFFWSKLIGEGYENARLAKWTKKFDIFAKDIVLIPINHDNWHWTAAAINFRRKRVESHDNLGVQRKNVCKALRGYLDAEHRDKKKEAFDFTNWVDYMPEYRCPEGSGNDCGVFTCSFLEALSRGEESFNFTQRDMPYLRRRMIWEIGNASLRDG